MSNNGTPLISNEFISFLSQLRIKHQKSSVYFPQSNGLIEQFHFMLKHHLAHVWDSNQVTLQCAIDHVLFDIHSSPATLTGATPFTWLFGDWTMRMELSLLSHLPRKTAAHDNAAIYTDLNTCHNAKLVPFETGDSVLMHHRWGDRFQMPGKVICVAGKGARLINTPPGQRIYNHQHLLPSPDNSSDDTHCDTGEAYDAVQSPTSADENEASSSNQQLCPRANIWKPEQCMFQGYWPQQKQTICVVQHQYQCFLLHTVPAVIPLYFKDILAYYVHFSWQSY